LWQGGGNVGKLTKKNDREETLLVKEGKPLGSKKKITLGKTKRRRIKEGDF